MNTLMLNSYRYEKVIKFGKVPVMTIKSVTNTLDIEASWYNM